MQKIIIATAFLLSSAASAIPETFLYVGDLDEDGAPADGNFSVTFQMFDDEEAGSKVFEETVASLVVVDGALVHELGASASDPLDDAELEGDLYLSVVVNGTVLEPRVPIRAVPFARSASTLAGATLADVQSAVVIADGAIQPRQIGGLIPLFSSSLGCSETIVRDLTLSSFCIALTDGCTSGQQRPCNSAFTGSNCIAITAGSRNCPNQQVGSLLAP